LTKKKRSFSSSNGPPSKRYRGISLLLVVMIEKEKMTCSYSIYLKRERFILRDISKDPPF
jgi:hypothetical protein